METRGSQNKKLIEILKVAGLYEDGMEVEEMRQVAQAIEMSSASFDSAESSHVDRALLESEIDFQMMVNSTMIVQPLISSPTPVAVVGDNAGNFDRDCESPPSNPIQMQVQAIVHHELNWSPTHNAGRPLKREASAVNIDLNSKRSHQVAAVEGGSRHADDEDATPISHHDSDSGFSCNGIGTLSSLSEHSTIPSIGEMPSLLLISTSSAAVSDSSSSHNHSSSQLEHDHSLDM